MRWLVPVLLIALAGCGLASQDTASREKEFRKSAIVVVTTFRAIMNESAEQSVERDAAKLKEMCNDLPDVRHNYVLNAKRDDIMRMIGIFESINGIQTDISSTPKIDLNDGRHRPGWIKAIQSGLTQIELDLNY